MISPGDLTERQREVAERVASGWTSKRIHFALGISVTRVNVIISSIAFRIGADPENDERVEIALWWRRHQLDPAA